MKKLILIRHAKSSWKIAELEDSWRPLSPRGYRQLASLTAHIPHQGLWLVSPAVRTYATAHVLRRLAGLPMGGLLLDDRLYESSGHNLMTLLRGLDDVDDEVTLIGHSPGLDELTQLLCHEHHQPFGTGDLVTLQLQIKAWSDCRENCGQVLLHLVPRD
ncbi:SixA phosphatase family protein [Pseudaeromonas sharmana]|uniref:SixA phosphatase family protein n=1 Tax=Pseudaeromonas sharmana TaxID=328412 RepID=A0ABV8CQ46_9GAMM